MVLGLFDGTGAQIQDKKSDVGEKRCLWRILENRESARNISPVFTTHALLLWGASFFGPVTLKTNGDEPTS